MGLIMGLVCETDVLLEARMRQRATRLILWILPTSSLCIDGVLGAFG